MSDEYKNGVSGNNPATKHSPYTNDNVKHPIYQLKHLAEIEQLDIFSETFAKFMDKHDEIAHLRQDFFYPQMKDLPGSELCKICMFIYSKV